ncbi:hypothetical protein AYI70_g3104 [Smittium culicis]|uniref:Uncharacterized protein n=1 Tax=Smittium culicis TaxID=133412 RepID=A0A1R1Y5K2_9FUNG|nr:hypothetical protein AYI70_g3104 [Smittium culicis]
MVFEKYLELKKYSVSVSKVIKKFNDGGSCISSNRRSLMRTLNSKKEEELPNGPNTLVEMSKISEESFLTLNGDQFLIYSNIDEDTMEIVAIFATRHNLINLSKSKI